MKFTKRFRKYQEAKRDRYHATLKDCQRYGQRLGTESRVDGLWTYYQLGDAQYRFTHNRVVGPITGEQMRHFKPPVSARVRQIYREVMAAETNSPTRNNTQTIGRG